MAGDKTPQEAREKLQTAGTRMFAEKGFAGVSIRQLAEESGVNNALISYHFGGKEGLYEAVVTAQYERLVGRVEAIAASTKSPPDKLRAWATMIYQNHTQEQPLMARLIQGELSSPTACLEKVVCKYTARLAQLLTGILRDGIQSGYFRNDIEPVFAALSLAGMINFYFVLREVTKTVMPKSIQKDQDFIEAALKIYLKGMGRD